MITQPHYPGPSPMTNVMVLLALLALLGLTIAVALLDVDLYLPGGHWGVGLAILIAAVKAALVIAYFMHVRFGTRVAGVFATAGFVWLGIMIALISTDYWFR